MLKRVFLVFLGLLLWFALLTACGAAEPQVEPIIETVVVEKPGETTVETEVETVEEPAAEEPADGSPFPQPSATPAVTLAAQPTFAPTQIIPTTPAEPQPTPTPLVEGRMVEIEWPGRLQLGDSDIVRLALIPTAGGYTLTTEFPDHQVLTQDVPVVRPEGYDLLAVGRLDGVGFTIAPAAEQPRSLPLAEAVVWHWSLTPQQPGMQRLTVMLLLRWVPQGATGSLREAVVYSRGLDVRVASFFGLTRGQALTTALLGLLLGGGLSGFALVARPIARRSRAGRMLRAARVGLPKRELQIESPAGLALSPQETGLLRALFDRYQRLLIQQEFLSGYSGARTFLLLPVRPDGRSDAATIAKLGERGAIEREYANYEAFVKHTLPPVTARIQAAPVTLRGAPQAALQYTFIGEPGSRPQSLGQVLSADPDPELLYKLFDTFGANWWMQRSPWSFRLAEEYDRLLPPHLVLEPAEGSGQILDGRLAPGEAQLPLGALVSLRHFSPKAGGSQPLRNYYSLNGEAQPGQPALRVHWFGAELPRTPVGRVVARRMDLLQSYVGGFDRRGLPDPLAPLEGLLAETVTGSRSIIHGDLNLENILVGPGGMVWLIDFATTREGHPLADFAHLEAEIIAHVLAGRLKPETYLMLLRDEVTLTPELAALRSLQTTLEELARRCLHNPSRPREYQLALYFSCLGALKYRNLTPDQKYLLYLTAAHLMDRLA